MNIFFLFFYQYKFHVQRPYSKVFYMHPAEVREQTFLVEKIQPGLRSPPSSFSSPAKKFLLVLYRGDSMFPLKKGQEILLDSWRLKTLK